MMRPYWHNLYSNKIWLRERRYYLELNTLCIICEIDGSIEPSQRIGYIVDPRVDIDLLWDQSN